MIFLITFLIVSASFIFILYKHLKEKNVYWEKKKIKFLKPKLLFGNSFEAVVGNKHTGQIIENAYLSFPDEEVIGHYEFMKPQLIIRKPEIINNILIKDFSYFMDRVASPGQAIKTPLSENLFNMRGQRWHALRNKLCPIFASGKLKYMFGPLADCGGNLTALLDTHIGKEVDFKEVMSLFSMDVIGSCAFGIDPGVLRNPSANFRAMGKKIFDLDVMQYFRFIVITLFPQIANKLRITLIRPHVLKYFCDVIASTLQFRKKHKIERNDFVQMLIELKESGKIQGQQDPSDDFLNIDTTNEPYEIKLSDDLLMGTAFGFISAGFHTTASTLTYVFYELAQQPDILEKVRREIKDQLAVHGNITYDALKCMIYLEKVLKETMRLHPAAVSLLRVCTKEYTFPCGLKVTPGDTVIIPVLALHRDPFFYSDPYIFNPNRFDSPPIPGTYLPFGGGPRICIAMRFAILEMKFAISKILLNYNIRLSSRTRTPLKMSPRGFLNTPQSEVYFHISRT